MPCSPYETSDGPPKKPTIGATTHKPHGVIRANHTVNGGMLVPTMTLDPSRNQGPGGLMAVETKSKKKTSPREVLERAKADGVEVVDVRFIDLPGTWQHFSLPLGELDESSFTEGLGFDGSSIRGFQAINESDMLLIPDTESATIDPVPSRSHVCASPSTSARCEPDRPPRA